MDETLIHSRKEDVAHETFRQHASFSVTGQGNVVHWVHVRPGARQFLAHMASHITIVIFTAGIFAYPKPILDQIDPENRWIAARLYQDMCTDMFGVYSVPDNTLFSKDTSRWRPICVECCLRMTVRHRPSSTLATSSSSASILVQRGLLVVALGWVSGVG
ncbi:NLI interacting factor-like phosphatase-domain-containing protein [Catenaria anguillulae PL171]|uniref:Mitochondrial import inner membrane translocase subunit TIM50 n=1 Tax=Catenaria anguillulae PL171 TaxID=765915 RepID=A0A1Y2HHC2_9FUNG|nr:NLI interacting factor-like phosphatase-domain-containing protein [Catenaria anguillulae PL171]